MNKIYYMGRVQHIKHTQNMTSAHNGWIWTNDILFEKKDENFVNNYFHSMYLNSTLTTNQSFDIDNEAVINILDKHMPLDEYLTYEDGLNIIFEIFEDENGFKYGKEIYTGALFPIIEKSDDLRRTYEAKITKVHRSDFLSYDLDLNTKLIGAKNPNILRIEQGIYKKTIQIANQNDIDKYLKDFKKNVLFKVVEDKSMIKIINKLANQNSILIDNIVFKEKEEKRKETQNPINIAMDNIEYLLLKLESINKDLYNEKKKEYENLLNNEDEKLTLLPFTLESLKSFEAELEFIIYHNKSQEYDDILSLLNNMITDYLNDKETERTIEDIDKISERVYKVKNKYSYNVQRKLIQKLALLYVNEIYKNKHTITVEDLKNSYFNDLLKTTLVLLNDMVKEEIIKIDEIINNDDVSLEYILNLIKSINRFNFDKEVEKKCKY